MDFKIILIGESSDGRYWPDLGTLYTALQPQVGMRIDYQGSIWTVRQVTWLPEPDVEPWWVTLDVRVDKED
jgi:hypothetical protein